VTDRHRTTAYAYSIVWQKLSPLPTLTDIAVYIAVDTVPSCL